MTTETVIDGDLRVSLGDIKTEDDIVTAVEILAGQALMTGNRRLYEHLYRAAVQHKAGVNLGWSERIGK